MALNLIRRNYRAFYYPPEYSTKDANALKFGILGAANIAPGALIKPARTHSEIIVYCVAARDESRARAYAKTWDIPHVYRSYQDVIDDPEVDCVYIPLPNSSHGRWALKALSAGKHVLLEKPSVANSDDAHRLFRHPILSRPDAPVLLEAFHYRFQPSWALFLKQINRETIDNIDVKVTFPGFVFPDDDIRFQYKLAGGTIMDLGTYSISALRQIAGEAECIRCDVKVMDDNEEKYTDRCFTAEWKLANGGVGVTSADLKGTKIGFQTPQVTVVHRPVDIPFDRLPNGATRTHKRTVYFFNHMLSAIYHYITVIDEFEDRSYDGQVFSHWKNTEHITGYTWDEAGLSGRSDQDFWTSYRHQLEAFVDKVRGREPLHWVDGEDSIKQMEMVDAAYIKAGLPVRPSGDF